MTGQANGLFVTLEGGEGVGKSTQIGCLAERLRAAGQGVVVTREPGGSAGAEAIRELLLHAPGDAWQAQAEALLFAAARSDHVARVIRPALAQGLWVLCDRFIDSTRAYQGGASGLDDAAIMTLHQIGSGGLLPHRTLLLELDRTATAQRRRSRELTRPDRFEDRDGDFHARVVDAFADLAEREPARFRRIDASGSSDAVTERIITALADIWP